MAKSKHTDNINEEGLQYNTGIGFVMRVNEILYKCYHYRTESKLVEWISQLDSLYMEAEAKMSVEESTEATKQLNHIYIVLQRDNNKINGGVSEYSQELVGECRKFEGFLRRTKFISELCVPERAFDTSLLV